LPDLPFWAKFILPLCSSACAVLTTTPLISFLASDYNPGFVSVGAIVACIGLFFNVASIIQTEIKNWKLGRDHERSKEFKELKCLFLFDIIRAPFVFGLVLVSLGQTIAALSVTMQPLSWAFTLFVFVNSLVLLLFNTAKGASTKVNEEDYGAQRSTSCVKNGFPTCLFRAYFRTNALRMERVGGGSCLVVVKSNMILPWMNSLLYKQDKV
jgi:hypothetical protein